MAETEVKNLYPPILDTFMPSFIESNCRIYFDFSEYNNLSEVKNKVQVTVRNLRSNINSLLNTSGVNVYEIFYDSSSNINKHYYIDIPAIDMVDGEFHLNEYYKVQMRFCGAEASQENGEIAGTNGLKLSWINQNLDYFSEWSTVCLVKRIEEPTLILKNFIETDNGYITTSSFLRIDSYLKFPRNSHNDYLTEYKLTLSKYIGTVNDEDLFEVLEETNYITGMKASTNRIKYNYKLELDYLIRYRLSVEYTINSGFNTTKNYDFILNDISKTDLSDYVEFNVTPELELGRNLLKFHFDNHNSFGALSKYRYLIIRRTSNKNNFTLYDDIAAIKLPVLTETHYYLNYYDESIESGIPYSYAIQLYGTERISDLEVRQYYSEVIKSVSSYINDFESMFINSQDKQLKLCFDGRIISYKRVTLETKTETLGSRYPFVRKNSATNYKQFSINGLISFLMDRDIAIDNQHLSVHAENNNNILTAEFNTINSIRTIEETGGHLIPYKDNGVFYSDEEMANLKGTELNNFLYSLNKYNEEHNINSYNDYTKERDFREKVIDFLTSGEVMLLRTMTEGNILVRLMDVNITPNQSLNNYICNFTATAIEIGECTPENYYKYQIFFQPYDVDLL